MTRSLFFRGSRINFALLASGMVAACGLGGCVESVGASPPEASLQQPPQQQASSQQESPRPRDGVSPRGASISLASLSGVPQPVADRIKTAFAQEAAERDITLANSKDADYFVRGYVNATPTESGTAITVVLDIFDAAKKRAQRFQEALFIKAAAAAADPWSVIDVAAIGDMASKSAENVAAFLTTTPQARAEAKSAPASSDPSPAKPESGRTIVQRAPPKLSVSKAESRDLNLAALR